ncbi:hypothetical protein KBP30_09945 [Streptomyces sp. Go40/10]|uniref:hypothetical protein n=1 Tax=Streptomyces sp. Go40/10 TaxID=2825844 RepID=UPI001E43E8D6|nr:hypothetical protein [Streptomyces sp. Go40/10]UFR01485.1 hypothetical protein KBP30_09945 [Streptomyces sp. Go40/10]
MTRPVVVAGGSVAGLACALALGRRGFPVTVLEQAPPPPEGPAQRAADRWHRPTVAQHGHSHILTSLGVRVLREHAPDVLDAALGAGARLLDLTDAAPDRLDDDELVALAVRRPVLELVLRQAVRSLPGVTLGHRVTVRGLSTAGRRVTGAVTGDGAHLPAHAVVDATGRRGAWRAWLAAAGLPVPAELTAPTRVRGFTRFYRQASPGPLPGPLNRGNAAGGIWGHYAAVAHPADNGTYALTLGVPTRDPATTGLRHPSAFTRVARLSPYVAAWADPAAGEPTGPVRPITLPPDILRPQADAQAGPVVGLYPVGDSLCVTNPLFGRGMSLALHHAFLLADLLDGGTGPAAERAERAAALADRVYRPWYEHAVREDAARTALWRAQATGGPLPATPSPDGRPALAAVAAAAAADTVVWRGLTRVLMGLDTAEDVFDDEVFRKRVHSAPAPAARGPLPPTRAELVRAVSGEEPL